MPRIVECIPNFSVGNDEKVLQEIIDAMNSVGGILLLDSESDSAHNRSVVTFAGEPQLVLEAVFRGCKRAAELINLDLHRGEHPRMGATDVIPLVPISEVSIEECILMAHQLAVRIAKELHIPVYLYEKAATRPERENLANIRRGEYEIIKKEIAVKPERSPDYGPKKLGTAGAVAVGVREALMAYNVNLDSADLTKAESIARAVRARNGGFAYVKALGFELKDRGCVQISMNLTNFKKSTIHHVFEFVKREASRYGLNVIGSEIIGLVPQEALFGAAEHFLQIERFNFDQVLEVKLKKLMDVQFSTLNDFIKDTASSKAVPGGGSVSALSGALAAALIVMVARLTARNRKYQKVHLEAEKIVEEGEKLINELYYLISSDSRAYNEVVSLKKQNGVSAKLLPDAIMKAVEVPMEIAEKSFELLKPAYSLAMVGNVSAISDIGVAAHSIKTAVAGAIFNVKINLKEIKDSKLVRTFNQRINFLEKNLDRELEKLLKIVEKKL